MGVTGVFAQAPALQLANPASQHCVAQGGKSLMEKTPGGGQYGVCTFEDNRVCEEWAMLRGQCPAGGIKVTGYVTPASRYCAITGGSYTVTSGSNTPSEAGTCKLPSGKTCPADAYFVGSCTPRLDQQPAKVGAATPKASAVIKAKFVCAGSKSIAAEFVNSPSAQVHLALSDGRKLTLPQAVSASGARYANASESFVFWNKGRTAFVQEGGQTTFADCVQTP